MRGYFNPRSPHGERPTEEMTDPDGESYISIHAPARGATRVCGRRRQHPKISIHAPRTGSDVGRCQGSGVVRISIHAPRTGSDSMQLAPSFHHFLFQSTLPARGATGMKSKHPIPKKFQSTLPARGATLQKISTGKMELISIHAPRTGSDATRIPVDTHSIISIHAPRTGSDDYSTSHKSGHPLQQVYNRHRR